MRAKFCEFSGSVCIDCKSHLFFFFGQFDIGMAETDPAFAQVVSTGGRAAQIAAMDDPQCYDDQTEELMGWFDVEVKRRGFKVAA